MSTSASPRAKDKGQGGVGTGVSGGQFASKTQSAPGPTAALSVDERVEQAMQSSRDRKEALAEQFGDDPSLINAAAIEYYTSAHCDRLASALSEETGWPVAVVGYYGWDEDADAEHENPHWVHVGVEAPDGRFLDIQGVHTGDELIQGKYGDQLMDDADDYGDGADADPDILTTTEPGTWGIDPAVDVDRAMAQRVLAKYGPALGLSAPEVDFQGWGRHLPYRRVNTWSDMEQGGDTPLLARLDRRTGQRDLLRIEKTPRRYDAEDVPAFITDGSHFDGTRPADAEQVSVSWRDIDEDNADVEFYLATDTDSPEWNDKGPRP